MPTLIRFTEEVTGSGGSEVPPWAFGAGALATLLLLLLIVTRFDPNR